jgi:guanine deaminase
MASQKYTFYKATILNPQSDGKCDFLIDGLLVTKNQKVKDILAFDKGSKKYASFMTRSNTHDFGHAVIMPAFFDMHFHWVQDDVREMPKDSLLEWLEKYTFPTEMRYADKNYAEEKAKHFFAKLSAMGTIGGACYSSIHENALHAAMDYVRGEFVIGNVLMNMNSPVELTQSEEDALKLTKKLIKKYGRRHCFTPRFAITTTPKVMKKGSRLADEAKCYKQTHLSETPAEIDFVLSLYRKIPGFENVGSYTEIYQRTGMLGKRSLMGHGIHLSPKELNVLSKTKTSIIHCPTSNAPIKDKGLGSGLFDFRMVEKAKVRWALGSDIGGGPFLSMFDVMRSFVDQNKKKKINGATYVKALFRSTVAAAEIMGLSKRAGNLDKNKDANFIVVPLRSKLSARNAEEALTKLIGPHRLRRENYSQLVSQTYYQGELIAEAKKVAKARSGRQK